MRTSKISFWDVAVIISFFIVSIAFLFSNNYSSIFAPLLAGFLIGLYFRMKTYFQLRDYSGNYVQFNMDLSFIPDRTNKVKYAWFNIFKTQPRLFASQQSYKRGDWESLLNVSALNPFIMNGFYKYTTTGRGAKNQARGGKRGNWGVHKLHINPDTQIIHVQSIGKGPKAEDEYMLIRETHDIVIADRYIRNIEKALIENDSETLTEPTPINVNWDNIPYQIYEKYENVEDRRIKFLEELKLRK